MPNYIDPRDLQGLLGGGQISEAEAERIGLPIGRAVGQRTLGSQFTNAEMQRLMSEQMQQAEMQKILQAQMNETLGSQFTEKEGREIQEAMLRRAKEAQEADKMRNLAVEELGATTLRHEKSMSSVLASKKSAIEAAQVAEQQRAEMEQELIQAKLSQHKQM